MTNEQILFFKDIEMCISAENIMRSRTEFIKSFDAYGLNVEKTEETDFDIVLYFENSYSSWRDNFILELESKFNVAQIEMEKHFLIGGFVNFHTYVSKSLTRISQLDSGHLCTPFTDKLLNYFSQKYGLDFSAHKITSVNPLKHIIKESDLQELYNLSEDYYINDHNCDIHDFISFCKGELTKGVSFKCSTGDMVVYIKNLLFIFEDEKPSNIDKNFLFYTKHGNRLTANSYRKYLSTSTVSLLPDLILFYQKLKERIK